MQKITSVLALALLCILGLVFADKLNDPELINFVNSHPQGTWKAKAYPRFQDKTIHDVSHLFGAYLPPIQSKYYKEPEYNFFSKGRKALPENFDSAKEWPKYVHPIRDQASCGSCWAFASSEMLSDRFAIATNGSVNVVLSPQFMVSCDKYDHGCQGGNMDSLWKFLTTTGTVSDECWPYESGTGHVPKCRDTCVDGNKMTMYKADQATVKNFGAHNVADIQQDILEHGPIMTGFMVYRDFMQYHSGVYKHISGGLMGGHAVKVTGWGVDSASGLPYWIVANSWGADWGMNGFFWILRGSDECQFESYSYTALPLLN